MKYFLTCLCKLLTQIDTGVPPSNIYKYKTLVLVTQTNTCRLRIEKSHVITNHDYDMLFNLHTLHVLADSIKRSEQCLMYPFFFPSFLF
jgi:hypothetical protein